MRKQNNLKRTREQNDQIGRRWYMYSIDPSNNNHTGTGKTLSAQQNAVTAMNQDSTVLPNTNKMHSPKERPYHLKRTQLKEFDSRSAAADPSFHTVSPKKMKPTVTALNQEVSMHCYDDDTIANNNSNAMKINNTAASNSCEGNALLDFDLTSFDLHLAPPYGTPMSFGYQNDNPFEPRKQQEIDGNRNSRLNASPLTASSLSQLPLRNKRQNMKSIINCNNCSRNIYSSRMKNEEEANILHKQELNRRKRNCEKISIWNLINN